MFGETNECVWLCVFVCVCWVVTLRRCVCVCVCCVCVCLFRDSFDRLCWCLFECLIV